MKNIFKLLIRNAIHRVGYDLVKLPQRKIPHKSAVGFPTKVEFIGPSGVGKTTVVNEMCRNKSKNDKWILAGDLLKYDTNELINEIEDENYDVLLNLFARHILSELSDVRQKIILMRYFLKLVINEEYINYLSGNKVVVFHEGLFHNGTNSMIQLEKEHPDCFAALIKNRVIINCVANHEFVVNNIKNRKAQGVKRYMLDNHKDEVLLEKTRRSMEKKAELVHILQKHGIPILEINTANNILDNANLVKSFINSLKE